MSPAGVPGPEDEVDALNLLSRCTFPSSGEYFCAVSGGADSLALMILAVGAGCKVTAIHVDHGLRAGSADEAQVVADAAARYGAAFRSEKVEVEEGPNLEARARAARKAVLPPGCATGHTMDDQAETVLINMLRGAGIDGLRAMRAGPEHPILSLRRSETRSLCAGEGLRPVEDPSNEDSRFLRNRVRHELLPLCCEIAGRDVVPLLARQAELLAGDAELLDEFAAGIDASDGRALASAPKALARRATRRWLRGGGHPPDLHAVDRVLEVATGKMRATDVAPGVRVRRSRGVLAISEIPDVPPGRPRRVR